MNRLHAQYENSLGKTYVYAAHISRSVVNRMFLFILLLFLSSPSDDLENKLVMSPCQQACILIIEKLEINHFNAF